jgi:sialic acid synthase SpsE
MPEELCALVQGIRTVESGLGNGLKVAALDEYDTAAAARKSLVAATDLSAGTLLTAELIAVKRPGTGLPPSAQGQLLGRRLRQDMRAGTPFKVEMLA